MTNRINFWSLDCFISWVLWFSWVHRQMLRPWCVAEAFCSVKAMMFCQHALVECFLKVIHLNGHLGQVGRFFATGALDAPPSGPTTLFWMTWDLRGHRFREALWLKQLDCRNPRGNDRFRGASCDCCHVAAGCRVSATCLESQTSNPACGLNSSGRIWENRPSFLYPQMFDAKNHLKSINILSESAQIPQFFHDFSRSWKKGFWPSCDSWRPRPGRCLLVIQWLDPRNSDIAIIYI